MSFFSSLKRSWRKSSDLKRISATLASPPAGLSDLMSGRSEVAENELFDLVEKDEQLRHTMLRYGASRDTLKSIYRALLVIGAGQWARGHWVPASTFAFEQTLEYVLRKTNGGKEKNRDVLTNLAIALVDYFDQGKTGAVE